MREGFIDMIREIWSTINMGVTSMGKWRGKIRRVRHAGREEKHKWAI
jgi:hypothetical protein